VLALEEALISMCQSSGIKVFVSIANLNDRCFCLFFFNFTAAEGRKDGVPKQSSLNLGDTLVRVTGE